MRKTDNTPRLNLTAIAKQNEIITGASGTQVCTVNGRMLWGFRYLIGDDWIGVAYYLDGKPMKQKIEMIKEPVHLGGFRYFLRCPECGHRRKHIYLIRGEHGCRECMGIRYASRSMGSLDSKVNKLRNLLKNYTDITGRTSIYDPPVRKRNQRYKEFFEVSGKIKRLQQDILHYMATKAGIML